ncbi:hypothetical protein [Methylobacterium oryzisoli]
MTEHLAFITRLFAKSRLKRFAETLPRDRFSWTILDPGVMVAA